MVLGVICGMFQVLDLTDVLRINWFVGVCRVLEV